MKVLDIAMFVFIFGLIIGTLDAFSTTQVVAMNNTMYLFGGDMASSGFTMDPNYNVSSQYINGTLLINDLQEMVPENTTYYEASILPSVSWIIVLGSALFKFLLAVTCIGHYIASYIPGMPQSFAFAMDLIMWIPYSLAIIQFVTGRSLKLMR